VAAELHDGAIVNLGSGIPSLVKNFLDGKTVYLQTENGVLGVGPAPDETNEDYSWTDAMGGLITLQPGASITDSANAFTMIRGGHVDVTVLGAVQVSQHGDIANWSIPKAGHYGVGGAMDLASGARRVIAAMSHTGPENAPKVVPECTLPVTAPRAVDTLITELATFDFRDGAMILRELHPGVTHDELRARTTAHYTIP
jgi:3-oxoacid CoA-transferase B subunit